MKNNRKCLLFFLILISLIEFVLSYNIYFIVIYIISFMSSLFITNNPLISLLISIILANLFYIITSLLIEPMSEKDKEKEKNVINKLLKWRGLCKDKNDTDKEHGENLDEFIRSIFDSQFK